MFLKHGGTSMITISCRFDIINFMTMKNQVNAFVHLEQSFPKIIRKVKVYMSMDQDFLRLCRDFEDVTETIAILENNNGKKTESILYQIAHYKQLKEELEVEIESFIKEEQKN